MGNVARSTAGRDATRTRRRPLTLATRRMTRTLVRTLMMGLAFACGGGPSGPLPPGGKRVLFVGNSLTYVNDLPRTIADLARSIDETPLVYRMVAKPDYALEDHWNDGIERRIAADGWQFVVMQQGPSSVPANQEFLRIWTMQFNAAVTAAGARSALFMVWPAEANLSTYDGVRTAYRNAALAVGGIFIPAGEAWRTAWLADPTLALYGDDRFHPSRLGTYLAALVHFEMLYARPAMDLPDTAIVDGTRLQVAPATVAMLQQAAHETVVAWGIH